nr:hypothetical protein [Tanacetum cinerariifolium]
PRRPGGRARPPAGRGPAPRQAGQAQAGRHLLHPRLHHALHRGAGRGRLAARAPAGGRPRRPARPHRRRPRHHRRESANQAPAHAQRPRAEAPRGLGSLRAAPAQHSGARPGLRLGRVSQRGLWLPAARRAGGKRCPGRAAGRAARAVRPRPPHLAAQPLRGRPQPRVGADYP